MQLQPRASYDDALTVVSSSIAVLQVCAAPHAHQVDTLTKLTPRVPQFFMRVGVWGVGKVPSTQLYEKADGMLEEPALMMSQVLIAAALQFYRCALFCGGAKFTA